jgi:sulfoxide reductase heme-binding subunit YedZ
MGTENRFNRFLKPSVFIISLLPAVWLMVKFLTAGLGANPVEKMLHHTGDWALNFLVITLAVGPLHKLTGFSWPLHVRRMIGLFSFFYASLHLITYVAIDQFFAFTFILEDALEHKRILVGFATYLMLFPMAVTSSNAMIQRLGLRKWQTLHGLVYIAGAGGVIHYLLLVKIDTFRPTVYAWIVVFLLVFRIVDRLFKKK